MSGRSLVLLILTTSVIHQVLLCPTSDKSNGDEDALKTSNGTDPEGYTHCSRNSSSSGRDPCSTSNGGCDQLCVKEFQDGQESHYCRCNVGYRLLKDKRKCTKCNVVVHSSDYGEIRSYGYPRRYDGMSNCTWIIHPKRYHFLHIHFLNFDVKSTNCCSEDYLEIVTPNRMANGFMYVLPHIPSLPRKLCGFYSSLSFYWMGKFTLNFRTSSTSSVHTGFRMFYQNKPKSSPAITLWELLRVKVRGGILGRADSCT